MSPRDPFRERTFIQNPDDDVIVQKKASLYLKGVPRLEAHHKSKTLSNRAFGIGRDRRNGVIILDDEVSKYHAVIKYINNLPFIHDIHSTNGTFINEKRIPPNKNIQLQDGDKIRVGKTEIICYCS